MPFRHGDHTHTDVDVARLCEMGLTFPCGDYFMGYPTPDPDNDDGSQEYAEYLAEMCMDGPTVQSCTAARWETDRGSRCEHGHEYVTMEVRRDEGWDYAADEGEAGLLAKYGTFPVAMDGTGIHAATNV
jgi:hypothetical protein